jgi:DNA polymerase-3 subunit beta
MIISCEKAYLSEAVNTVSKAASVKSPLPVLEGILISTDGDCILLTANNLELGIECRIPAEVIEEGSVVISDARVFSEIIRKLPNDFIHIDVRENLNTTIKCQNSVYQIMSLGSVEFPELPVISEDSAITISSLLLKSMIRQTSYAIAQKNDKPVLTGSLFEIEDNTLSVVSLDGFRLAVRKEIVTAPENRKFIIPGKTLSELSKILKDDDNPVTVKVTDKYALFEVLDTKVISRLIDGEYFNYKSIIPRDFKIKTKVNLADIITCVERADPIVSVDVFKNPVKMTLNDDTITIDCMTSTGVVKDVIEIESCKGEIEIGFNQKYLHDALSACECEVINMEFNGSLNPCIITPEEGGGFIYMVLPVRLTK